MAIESPVAQRAATGTFPYALLRAGYPYYTTLGMRRVTTFCMDLAVGAERRLYVLCRDDGQGGQDTSNAATDDGKLRGKKSCHQA